MFGRKLEVDTTQWVGGRKVETEVVRPFLLDGEVFEKGHEVVSSLPLGRLEAGEVFSGVETVALLKDPTLPSG